MAGVTSRVQRWSGEYDLDGYLILLNGAQAYCGLQISIRLNTKGQRIKGAKEEPGKQMVRAWPFL
jgi:hypothetical protein